MDTIFDMSYCQQQDIEELNDYVKYLESIRAEQEEPSIVDANKNVKNVKNDQFFNE